MTVLIRPQKNVLGNWCFFYKAVGWENNGHIYEYLTTTDIWVLKQIYFHKYLKIDSEYSFKEKYYQIC